MFECNDYLLHHVCLSVQDIQLCDMHCMLQYSRICSFTIAPEDFVGLSYELTSSWDLHIKMCKVMHCGTSLHIQVLKSLHFTVFVWLIVLNISLKKKNGLAHAKMQVVSIYLEHIWNKDSV